MMHLYDIITLFVPLMTFMISVFFNRNKTPIDTAFSIITGYIFLTELLEALIGRVTQYENYFIYNHYTLLFPLLNFRLFYILTNSSQMKKRIKFLAFLLVLVFIVSNLISNNLFVEQQYYTYFVSLIFLIYMIFSHLLHIMESDTIQYFHRSKSFWISLGLLLFSVPFLPLIIAFKFMRVNFEIRMIVTSILILAMHTCFILASLRTKYK